MAKALETIKDILVAILGLVTIAILFAGVALICTY